MDVSKRAADWGRYNLVENLLVAGRMPSRCVPVESGISFFIDSKIKEEGLCLVFQVDWKGDPPLIPQDEVKPDYLALFAPWEGPWLATIIELKGKNEQRLGEGIGQIQHFHEKYRPQIEAALPAWQRITWQGLLLHPQHATIPLGKIQRTLNTNCPIRPVQMGVNHRTDLYPFVRQRVPPSTTVRYTDGKNHPAPACFNPVEQVIACASWSHRGPPTQGGVVLDGSAELGDKSEPQRIGIRLRTGQEPPLARLESSVPHPELSRTLERFSASCRRRWTLCVPERGSAQDQGG